MVRQHHINFLMLLIAAVLVITGCSSSSNAAAPTSVAGSPNIIAPIIRVVQGLPIEKSISEEIIPQNNCYGNSPVSTVIQRSRTIKRSVDLGSGVTVSGSGEVGVPGMGDVQVGAEIAANYNVSYGDEETVSRNIMLTAKEGSNLNHRVRQYEVWETGEVIISSGNTEVARYPYEFRSDFKFELVDVEPIQCLTGNAASPLPTQTATVVPLTVTSPPPTATVIPPTATLPIIVSVTKDFTIQANQGWNDTRQVVKAGDLVEIAYISGLWTYWPGTIAPFDGIGTPDYICARIQPAANCVEPMPEVAKGALIVRIGEEKPIYVGNIVIFHVIEDGVLQLSMNHSKILSDLTKSEGSILVHIIITPQNEQP